MNGLICDNCQTVLALDASNGRESSSGESSAWLTISAGGMSFDVCTRSCAVELLGDDGPVRPILDAHLEVITSIANSIREAREADDENDDEAAP